MPTLVNLFCPPRIIFCVVVYILNNKEAKFQSTLDFHLTYNHKLTRSCSSAKKIPDPVFINERRIH
jgi:hypothetical protein